MIYKFWNFFFGRGQQNYLSQHIGFLILRFFLGLALCTVFEKFLPVDGIWGPQEWFVKDTADMGFPIPKFFAWIAVLSEFFGGILLMLGLFTRPAAFMNVFVTFTASIIYHKGDIGNSGILAFYFMIMCICILLFGPGKFSLDHLINSKRARKAVTLCMIFLFYFSFNEVTAQINTSRYVHQIGTLTTKKDTSTIEFYIKNKSILPLKTTFILYMPYIEGNSTLVKLFLPFQRIKFDLPIGSKVYLANNSQIETVMQGKRIDMDIPFIEVSDKLKNSVVVLHKRPDKSSIE